MNVRANGKRLSKRKERDETPGRIRRRGAFHGTAPEQLRPRLLDDQATTSRRSLLPLPPLTYEALPRVPEEGCHEPQRCRLCIDACPRGALDTEAGRVVVDAACCDGCGLCVAACPRGVVELPAASLAEAGPLATCRSCGRPIAPRRLLERVGQLVADEPLLAILAERCADCRSLPIVAERSSVK